MIIRVSKMLMCSSLSQVWLDFFCYSFKHWIAQNNLEEKSLTPVHQFIYSILHAIAKAFQMPKATPINAACMQVQPLTP